MQEKLTGERVYWFNIMNTKEYLIIAFLGSGVSLLLSFSNDYDIEV